VLAGPVNFFWLRRRKQPLLALVTVPVLGFGTTLGILGYGAFHDGFGVRGVASSWTWLDQERHEAAVHCARTLFAGRAPDAFTLGPDTLLLAPRGVEKERGRTDRWHCDAASWRLDGGLLPSRTQTPLCTVQQGPARQRLVVRRDGNKLLLLTDGGVQPVGAMVLRDFDGGWWVGEVPHLRAAAAHEAEAALAELRRAGSELTVRADQPPEHEAWDPHAVRNGHRNGTDDAGFTSVGIGALGPRFFAADGLAPGSYVAKVAAPPWLDEHGLRVEYDGAVHFVHGKLAREDLGR
jgi:hypothetical protein